MARETLTFIAFFALLALAFKFGASDWRFHQGEYRQSAFSQSIESWERGDPSTIPPDSLVSRLESLEINSRLESLADSLAVLRAELDGYEDLLLSVRDAVAGMDDAYGEESGKYFSAVRAYRRLDAVADGLSAEIDSVRQGLRAADLIERGGQSDSPGAIKRISPSLVPVSEACITCHLPLPGKERVMLYPGSEETVEYPSVMASHDFRRFGCTVCHAGAAASLDFRDAHGPDHMLRPFRPGKLALRACGICHAALSPLVSPTVAFTWPEACAACHDSDLPAALADSSGNHLFDIPLSERAMRNWLLRHWAEKNGSIPDRMAFENTLAMLVSGDVRRMIVEQALGSAAGHTEAEEQEKILDSGELATCPKCGRNFTIGNGGRVAVCPLDGTALVPVRSE